VKASHSATVTRVTPEDLFYLKSRGLPDRLARRMFVEGFLSDLSERVVNLAVREEMLEALREAYERK
jgi:Fe-S cluster assembly protein SufD